MPSIAPHVVEPALQASADPLAADLLARLRHDAPEPVRARATHPFSRREALRIYRDKAGKGDRPSVRTDGYPALLAIWGPRYWRVVGGELKGLVAHSMRRARARQVSAGAQTGSSTPPGTLSAS